MPMMSQKVDLETSLQRLDSVVAVRDVYIQRHQQEIEKLKKTLETTTFVNDKYGLCKQLYDDYQKFDPDSAMVYAKRCMELSLLTQRKDEYIQSQLDILSLLIYRGIYISARNLITKCGSIDKMPQQLQAKFAIAIMDYYMRLHGAGLGDEDDPMNNNLKLCWNTYQKYVPRNIWQYDFYESSLLHSNIIPRMLVRLRNIPQPSFQAAMIQVAIASQYKLQGNDKLYYYYLIQSAINDISMANHEAQSMLYLIESPYIRNNYKRAYNYGMVCSENAMAYKDMRRSLDVVKAHTRITETFKNALERRATFMIVVITMLILSLAIIIALLWLILKKRKKEKIMLVQLQEMNTKLHQSVYEEKQVQGVISENNKRLQTELKYRNDNFVHTYMMVSQYIADVQKFKKSVCNLIIAGKVEKAKHTLGSTTDTEEYLQSFYKQFDKAYLSTHPDFVERFNKFLKPDKQMSAPSDDSLTPELRIYALVSLGITDSVRIAEFLHYSPQTIYNYRLKVRHNACIPEKDFSDTVSRMYYQ